jgi:hypothetical protein
MSIGALAGIALAIAVGMVAGASLVMWLARELVDLLTRFRAHLLDEEES